MFLCVWVSWMLSILLRWNPAGWEKLTLNIPHAWDPHKSNSYLNRKLSAQTMDLSNANKYLMYILNGKIFFFGKVPSLPMYCIYLLRLVSNYFDNLSQYEFNSHQHLQEPNIKCERGTWAISVQIETWRRALYQLMLVRFGQAILHFLKKEIIWIKYNLVL